MRLCRQAYAGQEGEAVELRSQLDRLEGILASLTQGGYQGPSGADGSRVVGLELEERDSAVEALSLLAVRGCYSIVQTSQPKAQR